VKRLICASAVTTLLAGALTATALNAYAAPAAAAIQIGTGTTASYLITADGRPYAAGDNGAGELTGSGARTTLAPMTGLPSGVRATGIAGGYDHSVVAGSNGVAYASGRNLDGQVTGTVARSTLTPMAGLPAGTKAIAVAAGGDHTLVLGSNGVAYGTGGNGQGQLTGPIGTDKTTLVAMTGLPGGVKATAIATSPNNSLVLGSNGVAYGAGANTTSQLAFPNGASQNTLVPLGGLPAGVKATAVSSGFQFSLVLGSDGTAYGAGYNENSQLSGFGNRSLLAPLLGLPFGVKAVKIAAGNYHSLVIGADGIPYGTGYNHDGEVTGSAGTNKSTLTPMTGLPAHVTARQIAGSELTSLVLGSDNTLYGAGDNAAGQLTQAGLTKKYTLTSFAGQTFAAAAGPVLSGPVRVGTTLTARTSWLQQPTAYAYQWRRNGTAIAGATGSTYIPKVADLGRLLSVTLTATRSGFVTTVRTTPAVRVRIGAPLRFLAPKKPVVSGTAKVGRTLKVRNVTRAAWSPDATKVTYRWYRGSKPIKGATHATYRLTKADKGQRIRVRVSGQRAFYAIGTYLTTTTQKVKG
jgi:alpha-tubulin suppressor-like RCC1 family protein